jgi:hypothetical protein
MPKRLRNEQPTLFSKEPDRFFPLPCNHGTVHSRQESRSQRDTEDNGEPQPGTTETTDQADISRVECSFRDESLNKGQSP